MIEKKFVDKKIRRASLEEYLDRELDASNYSHIDVTKTSTSTKISLYSEKPGLVIGRGGHRIKEITEKLKNDFGIENPQVDVNKVENPDTDAAVVAKNVQDWLEKGGHPKRVGNTYVRRVREGGAAGVQIEISGKLSGSRGRTEKFTSGYVKKCGETAGENVDYAYVEAVTQPGALGVKVRIMKEVPDYMKRQRVEFEEEEEIVEEAEEDEESEAEESGDEAEEKEESEEVEEVEKSGEPESDEIEGSEVEEPEEPEEPSDTDSEGSKGDVDYQELADENIKDIKAEFSSDRDIDPERMLEAEKANKNRKTMKQWLEEKIEEE
ncbi:MAG: 30S ribosomal protein S3 [Candidatus Nanohaloarchaea archaeon]|nr:30S ribosomal protein S3 [Candidatus Nanohaloarchaea archaeon]